MANVSSDQDQPGTQQPNLPTVVDLDYPQILLQASFTSLLSNSFPSPSDSQITAMPSSSPERSLSESWASLSTSDFSPDDDVHSETTDIVSLIDTNASEDLQSANVEDEEEQQHEDEITEPVQGLEKSASIPTPIRLSTANIGSSEPYDSTATLGTPSPNAIKFEEVDSWPSMGRVDLRHSVKVFNNGERAELARSIPRVARTPHLIGTIRMTTSKGNIRHDRPFRLLYSGPNNATETRAEILRKLGDVLVATSEMDMGHNIDASRYHVIPSEFGPGSSPNFAELIPLHFQQMIVDECVDATAFKKDSSHSQILLNYKGGQSILSMWDGNGFRLPKGRGWDPPDLAIVFVSEDDNSIRKLFNGLVCEFMSRHNIPSMVIRDDNEWSATYDHIVVNTRSLHMCLESRSMNAADSGILRILPVDLATFVNLDATQLNRHIACLSDIHHQFEERKTFTVKASSQETLNCKVASGDVEKNMGSCSVANIGPRGFFEANQDFLLRTRSAILTCVFLYCGYILFSVFLTFLAAFFQGTTTAATTAASTSAQPIISITTTSAAAPTVLASASLSSLQRKESVVGLSTSTTDTDLARLVSSAVSQGLNMSENFQVQILGDGHLVVKAPQKILQKRKSPKINIVVMRGSTEVSSNTSKLFDGLYTVKIPREHAHGFLNVSVTVQKPAINETYELDFGNPWLSAGSWKDAVQKMWSPILTKANFSRTNLRAPFDRSLVTAQGNVEAVTVKAVEIAKKMSTEYGPTIRKLSLQARCKSKEFFEESAYRAGVAANALTQDVNAALATLETYSRAANDGVSMRIRELLSGFKATANKMRDRGPQIDLGDMRGKVMDSTRSETLARAQERARQIVQDSIDKLKRRAEHRGCRKPKQKTAKKRGSKKPWHSNIRVNW